MTDSILVIGGGVAGLTAAIECASAGANVIVAEHDAIVGGRLAAAMTDDSSTGGRIDGVPVPTLAQLAALDNIEVITLTDLENIQGRPGNFQARLRERARFVTDTCTRCNRCKSVCPSISANEYNDGLTYRKAIFSPLSQTTPYEYVIDIASCLNTPPNYLPCNRCIEVCDDNSIHFDLPLATLHERHVGAVILATGFDTDKSRLGEYGYGTHPDIVTTAELQHLLIAPGPTGGYAAKLSNEEYPESIFLVLDELSELAAYTAISQIHQLMDQDIERIVLLITTQPDTESQPAALQNLPAGIEVCWGLLQNIEADSEHKLSVSYADFCSNRIPKDNFDMVVLASDVAPAEGLDRLAQIVGVNLGEAGYVAKPEPGTPCATSQPGIYVAGGAGGPVTLPQTVEGAKAAALAALTHLDPRLLRAEYRQATSDDETVDTVVSPDDLRDRIERALYALLNRSE